MNSQRPAQPGEVCTCGRPAVTVFVTDGHGPVGYCGIPDGGETSGPCPFCGAATRHEAARCPLYTVNGPAVIGTA